MEKLSEDSALLSAEDDFAQGYVGHDSPNPGATLSLELPSDDDSLDLVEEEAPVRVSTHKRGTVSANSCGFCDKQTACVCPSGPIRDHKNGALHNDDAVEPDRDAFRICNQAVCVCPKIPKMSSDFCQSLDRSQQDDVRANVTVEVTDRDVIASAVSASASHDVMSYCSVQNLFKEQETRDVPPASLLVPDQTSALRCKMSAPNERNHLKESWEHPEGCRPVGLSRSIEDNEQEMIRALTRTPAFLRDTRESAASAGKIPKATEKIPQNNSASALCTFRFCQQDRTQLVVQNISPSAHGYTVQGINSVASVGSTMSLPQPRDDSRFSPSSHLFSSYTERPPSPISYLLPLCTENASSSKSNLSSVYKEGVYPVFEGQLEARRTSASPTDVPSICENQTSSMFDSHVNRVPRKDQLPATCLSIISPAHDTVYVEHSVPSVTTPTSDRGPEVTSYHPEYHQHGSNDAGQHTQQREWQDNNPELFDTENGPAAVSSHDSPHLAEQAGGAMHLDSERTDVLSAAQTASSLELEQNLRLANEAAIQNMASSSCNRYPAWTENPLPSLAARAFNVGTSDADQTTTWAGGYDVRYTERGRLVELSMSGSGYCSTGPSTGTPSISTWIRRGNVGDATLGLGLGAGSSVSGSEHCCTTGHMCAFSASMWTNTGDVNDGTPERRSASSMSGSGYCSTSSVSISSVSTVTNRDDLGDLTLSSGSSLSGSGYRSTGRASDLSFSTRSNSTDVGDVAAMEGRSDFSMAGSGRGSTRASANLSDSPSPPHRSRQICKVNEKRGGLSSSCSTQTGGSRIEATYWQSDCSSSRSSRNGRSKMPAKSSDGFSGRFKETRSPRVKPGYSESGRFCRPRTEGKRVRNTRSRCSRNKDKSIGNTRSCTSMFKARRSPSNQSSIVSSRPGSVCGRSACARRIMDRPSSGDSNSSMSCQQGSTGSVSLGAAEAGASRRLDEEGRVAVNPESHLTITIELEDASGRRQRKRFTLRNPRSLNTPHVRSKRVSRRRPKKRLRMCQWRRNGETKCSPQRRSAKTGSECVRNNKREEMPPALARDHVDLLFDAEVPVAEPTHDTREEAGRPHSARRDNLCDNVNGVTGMEAASLSKFDSERTVRGRLIDHTSNNTAVVSSSSSRNSSKAKDEVQKNKEKETKTKAADTEKNLAIVAAFLGRGGERGWRQTFTATHPKGSPAVGQNVIMFSNFASKKAAPRTTTTTTTETASSLPGMPIFSFHSPLVPTGPNPNPPLTFSARRSSPSSVSAADKTAQQRQVDPDAAHNPGSKPSNRTSARSGGPGAKARGNKTSKLPPPASKKRPCVGPFSGHGSSSQKTDSQAESTTTNSPNADGRRGSSVFGEGFDKPDEETDTKKKKSKRAVDGRSEQALSPESQKGQRPLQPNSGGSGGGGGGSGRGGGRGNGAGGETGLADGRHQQQRNAASDVVEGGRVEEDEEPVEYKSGFAKERLYLRARRLLRQICYLKSKEEILFRAAIRIQHIRLQLQEEHSLLFVKARSHKSLSDRNCNRQFRRRDQKSETITKKTPGVEVSQSRTATDSGPANDPAALDTQVPSTSKIPPFARPANKNRARGRTSTASTQDDEKDDGKASILSQEEEEDEEGAGAADEKEGDDEEEEDEDDEDDDESGSSRSYDDDGDESDDSKMSTEKSKKTDGGDDDTSDDDSNDPRVCGFYRQS